MSMKRLAGFDNHGKLYDDGSRMRRSVDQDHLASALGVFEALKSDLSRLGIVETEYSPEENMFAHKKHIISYPHEWTAGMLKEAALFHLDLLRKLDEKDITLKDALPANIVFDFTTPIFVDFLSQVGREALDHEDWVVTAAGKKFRDFRRAILKWMYRPYFLVPLLEMGRRHYRVARTQLSTQACNMGTDSPRLEMRSAARRVLDLVKAFVGIRNNRIAETLILLNVRRILDGRRGVGFIPDIGRLQRLIRRLDVTPSRSGYSRYYELKNEDFDTVSQSAGSRSRSMLSRCSSRSVRDGSSTSEQTPGGTRYWRKSRVQRSLPRTSTSRPLRLSTSIPEIAG